MGASSKEEMTERLHRTIKGKRTIEKKKKFKLEGEDASISTEVEPYLRL